MALEAVVEEVEVVVVQAEHVIDLNLHAFVAVVVEEEVVVEVVEELVLDDQEHGNLVAVEY
jgi:hypothetical protein